MYEYRKIELVQGQNLAIYQFKLLFHYSPPHLSLQRSYDQQGRIGGPPSSVYVGVLNARPGRGPILW